MSIWRTILRFIAAVVAVYLLSAGYIAWQIHRRTDVDDYADYLAKWQSHLVAHFPQRIDERARNVAVSWAPGFLQGGAHLQLGMDVTTEQASRDAATAAAAALRVVDLAAPAAHTGEGAEGKGPDSAPLPPYYLAAEVRRFPPHYTLYYLFAQPGTTQGFPWNHGRTAGVAISRQPPRIVYWAESW